MELTQNDQVFLKTLATVDPALWRIKVKLLETSVNPDLLPAVIEAISYIASTTKHGQVEISIRENVVYVVYSHLTRTLDVDVVST